MTSNTRFWTAVAVATAMAVSGCTTTTQSSRNLGIQELQIGPIAVYPSQDWDVASVVVSVPRSLRVSEANGIKPRADIVWREDPVGDRHQQVQDLMRGALEQAFAPMQGSVPVQIEIEVTRFHALTERARYTTGGQHEIEFIYTVRHADSGTILSGPREVDLTFRAYGGKRAVDAEAQGITQRSRIVERLVGWVRTEFPQTAVARLPAT